MGMSAGGNDGGVMAEINVTPLVDVMLVLLIIFMITTPMMNHKVKVDLPTKPVSVEEKEKATPLALATRGRSNRSARSSRST